MAARPETQDDTGLEGPETQHDTGIEEAMDSVTLDDTPFTGSLEDVRRLQERRAAAPRTTLQELKRQEQYPGHSEGTGK
jgi:hypothetical protein